MAKYNDEFEEDRKGSRSSWVLWVLVIAFIAAACWAYFYRVDQVVRGRGAFIAASRVQVIQAVIILLITAQVLADWIKRRRARRVA